MHKLAHTFTATHCGQTYAGMEGAAALAAHMRTHGPIVRHGQSNRDGEFNGKPRPWKAPKAPADDRKLTQALVKNDRDVLEWHTEALVSADELAPGDVFTLRKGTERYRVIDAHPSPIDGNPLEVQLEIVGKPGPARWLPMAGRKQLVAAPVILLERAS